MSATVLHQQIMISNDALENAIAKLVRAAIRAREELSARGIRKTLEIEFACDLRAQKDLIMLVIQATLDEPDENAEERVGNESNNQDDAMVNSKRRKLSTHSTVSGNHGRVNAAHEQSRVVGNNDPLARSQILAQTLTGSAMLADAAEKSRKSDEYEKHLQTHGFAMIQRQDEWLYRAESETIHSSNRRTSAIHADEELVPGRAEHDGLFGHTSASTSERPYACSKCTYRCARRCDFNKHARVHTGERPYACTECNYRCSQGIDLTKHMRVHTGERPYACSECKHRCARSSDLIKHARVHTGERPYACDECDYRSAQSSDLTKHKLTHSNERK